MFLLDTDHITILQRGTQPEYGKLMRRMAQCSATDFFWTTVSFHEQLMGAHNLIVRPQTSRDVIRGFALLDQHRSEYARQQVLAFDLGALTTFESLRRQRVRIGTADLRIAAIALIHNKTVLTRNTGDFQRVPGLRVEDWTK